VRKVLRIENKQHIPVQVRSIMGRRTAAKYPHIPHNKPYGKETIQNQFKASDQCIEPTKQ
jgi:hypothetical protein